MLPDKASTKLFLFALARLPSPRSDVAKRGMKEQKEREGAEVSFKGSNKVSGWSHRQGEAVKGPELERSRRINHFTKMAIFVDFAISEASGKTACRELLDQIEMRKAARGGAAILLGPSC